MTDRMRLLSDGLRAQAFLFQSKHSCHHIQDHAKDREIVRGPFEKQMAPKRREDQLRPELRKERCPLACDFDSIQIVNH
ncbi:hypothetical protein [Ruegeria sp. MALMAid1280]|uniref:hypothetical protein n=1 Tax=Ruegeria sp. MALMAid1280 TaxID=3411634 RepID=UPI003BA2D039